MDLNDTLLWSWNIEIGYPSTKLVYDELNFEKVTSNSYWWHKILWKSGAPLKIRLFSWLVLQNKFLAWDNLLKWGWKGPIFCVLCKV